MAPWSLAPSTLEEGPGDKKDLGGVQTVRWLKEGLWRYIKGYPEFMSFKHLGYSCCSQWCDLNQQKELKSMWIPQLDCYPHCEQGNCAVVTAEGSIRITCGCEDSEGLPRGGSGGNGLIQRILSDICSPTGVSCLKKALEYIKSHFIKSTRHIWLCFCLKTMLAFPKHLQGWVWQTHLYSYVILCKCHGTSPLPSHFRVTVLLLIIFKNNCLSRLCLVINLYLKFQLNSNN